MSAFIAWGLVVALLLVTSVLLLQRRRIDPVPRVSRAPEPPARLDTTVVEHAREGLIVLNESMTPITANASARALLGFAPGALPATLRSDELLSLARRAVADGGQVEAEITLWPARSVVRVRAVPLPDPYSAALYLQDVTQDARLQQVRRQFVVNASHELKTPVTGLLALGEAVRDALPDDVPSAQRLSEQLVREAERLTKLTQDLLDLSRVEDPTTLATTVVRLADVARRQVSHLSDLATDHGVSINIEAKDDSVPVACDEQQVGLMIRNLIDNAIRYSDRGSHVHVELREEGGEAVIEVVDQGIGIPMRDQARVFERFYRVDEGRSRASGGTGLGLSIVRHVAESHGGHVSLQSELGEGSRFTIRLPRLQDDLA